MIIINTKKGKIQIERNSLLVFIDETGNEYLKDKEYPIFGLGGCAVICKEYNNSIRKTWNEMKDTFFDGKENKLHAKDLFMTGFILFCLIALFCLGDSYDRRMVVISVIATIAYM